MGKEKYTIEIKYDIVNEVLKGKSYAAVSDEHLIPKTVIERWVNLYKNHGIKGLESRNYLSPAETYDDDFRIKVIEYMCNNNLSFSKTAAIFMVDTSTISKWYRKYEAEGISGLMISNKKFTSKKISSSSKKDSKIDELIKENEHLRMENEYLKKLNALVQKREKSVKKIK